MVGINTPTIYFYFLTVHLFKYFLFINIPLTKTAKTILNIKIGFLIAGKNHTAKAIRAYINMLIL